MMTNRYYLDTSIWMDLHEYRRGFAEESLGEYAFKLLSILMARRHTIIITDILIKELAKYYPRTEIETMMRPFEAIIKRLNSSKEQMDEAIKLSKMRQVPPGDALHAILSRDNDLIFITRDKHFDILGDITTYQKPEEII